MPLSKTEELFVDAVRRDFRFLIDEYGFVEKPLTWDGHGISLNHAGSTFEVSNYLEGDEGYTTLVFPLREGSRLPAFDGEMDETFSDFFVEDLLTAESPPKGVASASFADPADLLNAVAARAAVLREHIQTLIADDGPFLALIRDRMRERLLRELVPKWVQFVEQVRRGYRGSGAGYVAGVNNRGAIRSLLSWPGSVPLELERQLRNADAQFDADTEPIALKEGAVRVLPHPRATRWFRRPKGGASLIGM